MGKKVSGASKNGRVIKSRGDPKSAAFLERGVSTDRDFINMSLAVAADIATRRMEPAQGNAIASHARNVLKTIELRYRYGSPPNEGEPKTLLIT